MLDPIAPKDQGQDYNQAAVYAQQYLENKTRLDLGPSIQKQDDGSFGMARLETPEDTAKFYEENLELGIDPNDPDAERTFADLTAAMHTRNTDYMQMFSNAAGEVAKIPSDLVEGVLEDPNPAKIAYSTFEGTARGLRDMWGMVSQSENPTSAVWKFRGILNAIKNGKPSQNWRDELDQWNEARRFNYHSYKMMNGDETLLEQFESLGMSDERKELLRSFVNPKVAHVMGFIGMELPSLIAAPFTGGASASLALSASTGLANMAANATMIGRIGSKMAAAEARFTNMAARATQRIAGHAISGVGSALEPIANIAEGVLGGSVKSIADSTGMSSSAARNAVQMGIVNSGEAAGIGGVRQTVGFIGSMGLRTTAEFTKELGETMLQRSSGAIAIKDINGLTVLERLALRKDLSPTARLVAKTANVLVDPMLQLSTTALKNSYKDALIFGGLGYLNDRDKGLVGGAAMGMVWGGYSGAFRHVWSNVNGGNSHQLIISNFDETFTNEIGKVNSGFASSARSIVAQVDALKSSKASANTRMWLRDYWLMLTPYERANAIVHAGTKADLVNKLVNAGLDASSYTFRNPESGLVEITNSLERGQFQLVKNLTAGKDPVPVVFLQDGRWRPADGIHEALGHGTMHALHAKGKYGEHFQQFIGNESEGGLLSDELLVQRAVQVKLTEDMTNKSSQLTAAFEAQGGDKSNMASFAKWVNEGTGKRQKDDMVRLARIQLDHFRKEAKANGSAFWLATANTPQGPMPLWKARTGDTGEFVSRYMFDETIAGSLESLYMHTSIDELTMNDSDKPLRYVMERWRNELFAKKVTELELAGMHAVRGIFTEKADKISGMDAGQPMHQAMMYEDGKYILQPELNSFIRSLLKDAINEDGQAVAKLSPERQAVEAKRFKKEWMFKFSGKGAVMHGNKELNEQFTERAVGAMSVIEQLPDNFKPDIIVDEHGNKTIDMYKMRDEAYDALIAAGVIDKVSADTAKGFRDTITRWEASGFAEGNVMSATYWGDSHRTIKRGLFERIFGKDVPITHRVFVPFELKLSVRTTDAEGKPLRVPKGGMVATVVDYMAIHRRKMKNWARPEFRRAFMSLDNFNSDFDLYLTNMMKEPATRVPSADLFRAKYGNEAESVRDMLYETFGGRKRLDEGFINAPKDSYRSNPEDPNYPIHSMKLDMIVNAERMPVTPFPYHHGRSYEGLRRNFSAGGFEVYDNKGNRLRNGQGYEVLTSGTKFKAFDPFGVLIGIYDNAKKAINATKKHFGKMDEADIMPEGIDPALLADRSAQFNKSERSRNYIDTISADWSNGVRYSVSGLDSNGQLITFVPSFKEDLYKMLEDSTADMWQKANASGGMDWTGKKNQLKSLTIGSLMNNASELARFRGATTILGEFKAEDIRVMPSPPSGRDFSLIGIDGKRGTAAEVRRISTEIDGRPYTLVKLPNTSSPVLMLDMKRIGELSGTDIEARDWQIQQILKKSIVEISMAYGPNADMFGFGITPIGALKPEQLSALSAVSEHLKKRLSNTTLTNTGEDNIAISDMRTRILDRNASSKVDLNVATNGSGLLEIISGSELHKAKTAKEIATAVGLQPNMVGELKSKNQVEMLRSIAVAFSKVNKEMEQADFVMVPNKEGQIASPVVNTRNMLSYTTEADAALRRAIKDNNANGNAYMSFANEMNHFLAQAHSNQAFLDAADASGTSGMLSVPFKGTKLNALPSRAIAPNFTLRSSNKALTNPAVFFFGKLSGGRESGVTGMSGFTFIVDSTVGSKNSLGGVLGSTEAMQFDLGKNTSPKLTDKSLQMGAFDSVTLNRTFGSLLKEGEVKRGNHMEMLTIASLLHMPNKEAEIQALYQKYKTTGNGLDYADQILALSIAERKGAAYDLGHAAYDVEFNHGPEGAKTALDFAKGDATSPDYALGVSYVKDASKTNFNHAVQQYWAIPSKDTTKFGEEAKTLYGRKVAAEMDIVSSIPAYEKFIKRASELHQEASSQYSKRLSVGSLDAVRDTDVRDQIYRSGLARKTFINGTYAFVFEFSDKNASLNLAKARGQLSLLPFVGALDPDKGLSDYKAAVIRLSANKGINRFIPESVVLGTARVGDIFRHDEMFEYYPKLRDMEIQFKDFHGARFVRYGTKGKIEVGVRSMVGHELNLPQSAGGVRIGSNESLADIFASKNPVAGMILHELQHAIQQEHGWIDNNEIGFLPSKIASHYLANLLGLKTNFSLQSDIGKYFSDPIIAAEAGKFLPIDAAKQAAKNEAELHSRLLTAIDSPVYKSLKANARPLMITAARNFADFVMSEHRRGGVDDATASSAQIVLEKAKMAYDLDSVVEAYLEMSDLSKSLEKNNPEYIASMISNIDFRSAKSAIGMVTTISLLDQTDPMHAAVSVANILRAYREMSYLSEPVEAMAFETQKRAGMGEEQLRSGKRQYTYSEDMRKDSTLGIIKTAFESSDIITDRQLGGMIRSGGVMSSIMKSVGGLGEISDKDSPVLTNMGKAVLTEVLAHKAHDIIDGLKRVMLVQRGWSVDKEGKLVLTSGKFLLKGATYDEFMGRLDAHFGKGKLESSDGVSRISADEMSKEGHTYSIEDLALLSSTVIESRNFISVGNSAIDAVLSPAFPDFLEGQYLVSEINKIGSASEDGIKYASAEKIAKAFTGIVLSKNDVVNLMAYHHKAISESTAIVGERSNPFGSGMMPNFEGISLDKKRQLLRTGKGSSVFDTATGMNQSNFSRIGTSDANKFQFGNFVTHGYKIKFNVAEAPLWVRELGDEAVSKYTEVATRLADTISKTVQTSFAVTGSENLEASNTISKAMNDRLRAKLMLIEPLIDRAVEMLKEEGVLGVRERVELAVSLMSEIEKAHYIMVASDIDEVTSIGSNREFVLRRGSSLQITDTVMDRAAKRLGFNKPPYALGGDGNMAYNFSERERINPLLMVTALNPYVISGENTLGHGTSTTYDVNSALAGGYRREGSLPADYRSTVASDNQNALEIATQQSMRRDNIRSSYDNFATALNEIRQVREESAQFLQNILMDIAMIEKGDADSAEFNSSGEMFIKIDDMSKNERTDFKAAIEKRVEQIDRESIIITAMLDNAADFTDQRGMDTSGNFLSNEREIVKDRESKYSPLNGLQAYATKESAIIELDTFAPSDSSSDSWSSIGSVMSLVPADIRKRYLGQTVYIDHAVQSFLFAELKKVDADGETVVTQKPFERLAPLHRIAKELAKNIDEATYGQFANQSLSHMVGGNAIISMGMAARGALNENMATTEYIRSNEALFRRLWAEDGVYAKPLVTRDAGLGIVNASKGVDVSHASIGVASAIPLLAMLNNGFMDFWRNNKELTMDIPEAFKSFEYELLMRKSVDSGLGKEKMDSFKADLDKFIDKLTDEDMDRLSHELSSIQNAETVVNLLAYINSRDLADEQSANPAQFAHAPPMVSLAESINLSLYTNAQHVVSGHAAIDNKDAGMGLGEMKEYRQAIKDSLRQPKFWHGFFAAMNGMGEMEGGMPATRGMNSVSPFYSRSSPDHSRGQAFFRYTGNKMTRFSKALGDTVDSYGNFEAHNNWTGSRMSLAETTFTKFLSGLSTKISPLTERISPELNGDIFHFSNEFSEIKLNADRTHHLSEAGSKYAPRNMNRWNDSTGEYDPIQRAAPTEQGGASITVKALRKGYSDGINRRLIVNQIANMAANLGKDSVSIQPARFPASSRPYWQVYGINSASSRADIMERPQGIIEKYLQHGGSNLENKALGSGTNGRMGFSWQRLEDGRIMVNYTPSIDIHALHDLTLGGIDSRTQLGINLRRAIGYDHGKGGLLIPQAPSRMLGIIQGLSGLSDGTASSAKRGAYGAIGRNIARQSPLDSLYMRHLNIAASRALRNGGHGELLSTRASAFTSTKNFGDRSRPHALIRELINGDEFNADMTSDQFAAHINGISQVLAQTNPEMAYMTMVLPKNATIDDFKRAVVSNMLSSGNRVHFEGAGVISNMSSNFHVGANSEGLGSYSADLATIKRAIEKRNNQDVGFESLSSGMSNEVSTWSPNSGIGDTSSGELLSNSMAEVLKRHSVANPRFIDQIERTFSMITSTDTGYHLPDAERALSNNGDRAMVIKNMFPNRPDLLHYAWDNESTANLSIVKPSTRGGSWMVGHDVVSGLDAAGNPMKRRVVRNFRDESQARAYADLQAGRSINAEIPRTLFTEKGFRIVKVAGKTNAEANVHEGVHINAEAYTSESQGETPNFVRNGKFLVGDFPTEFDTKETAQDFARQLLTSEVIQGEAPKNETIRLSAGGLSVKELEQDLRRQISFSSEGSPYQFSSTLMRTISDGVVNKIEIKNGRQVKTSTLAESATGNEWYESLVAQRVGKMEMRVTGMAQFLNDHKDVQISREELAQYAYAMYPRMGRVTYFRQPLGEVPPARVGMRIDTNPVASEYNNTIIYSRYLGKQMESLQKAIDTASDESKPSVVAAAEAVKTAHLTSFRHAFDMMYGKGAGEKMVPDAVVMMRIIDEGSKNPKINAGLLELYRLTYNDAYSKIQNETLSALGGGDMRIIDFNTAFGATTIRPKYLQMAEATPTSADVRGDFAYKNTDEDYKQWTSGAGPYQMDTIHGEIKVNDAKFAEFNSLITRKIESSKDDVERSKYQSMLASAKRIQEIRLRASTKHSVGFIHKGSREHTIQFAHLRYSNGAVMKHSWPNSDLTHLYDQIALSPDDAMPVTFIEELQSDTYQKASFGPQFEQGLVLPSEMSQAESFGRITELKAIDKTIAQMTASMSDKTYLARNMFGNTMQGTANRFYKNRHINYYFERMGVIERYIAYKLVESNDTIGEYVTLNTDKGVKVSKQLSDRMGVPMVVPRIEFKDAEGKAFFLRSLGRNLMQTPNDSQGNPMESALVKLFGHPNLDTETYPVPNLGNVTAYDLLYRGRRSNMTASLYSTAAMLVAHDEQFAAKAIEIAAMPDTGKQHGFNYDDLAARSIDEIAKRSEQYKDGLSHEQRRYFLSVVEDMRNLLSDDGKGLEHGYISNINREMKNLLWPELENSPEGRMEVVKRKKALFLVPSDSISEVADNQGKTVRALTLPESVEYDARMILLKNHDYATDIAQAAKNGTGTGNMTTAQVKVYAVLFDLIQGKQDRRTLTDSFWSDAIENTASLEYVQTVDNAYTEGYGDPKYAYLEAFPHTAKTALGKIYESVGHHLASTISSLSGNTELPALIAKREEIAKKIGLPAEKVNYTYPDIYPLGEDGAYRSAAINFYVMRGLQANKRGMTFADARHHRERYQATGNINYSMSLGKGILIPVSSNSVPFTVPYFLEVARNAKGNADFINRVINEGVVGMSNDAGMITHNGTTMSFSGHMHLAVQEGMKDVKDILSSDVRSHIAESVMSLFVNMNDRNGLNITRIIQNARQGRTISLKELEAACGNHSDGGDMLKRIHKMLDKPNSILQSIPYGKTHGYAANYGAPHWQNMVYYAGLTPDQIARQSHDLFERPTVELKDGKYNILDSKTGRLLIGGIESKEMMYERVAQLSKYLGASPIVSNFLKQYGRTGAHVLDSYMWTVGGKDELGFKTGSGPLRDEFLQMLEKSGVVSGTRAFITETGNMPEIVTNNTTTMSVTPDDMARGNNWANRRAKFGFNDEDHGNSNTWTSTSVAAYAHAMGVRENSTTQDMSTALTKMTGFTSPVLVFKPKFISETQALEMRKMIAEGIPFMSAGGLQDNAAKITEGIKAYKFFKENVRGAERNER